MRVGDHIQSENWRDKPHRTARKTAVAEDETHIHSDRPHLLPRPPRLGLDPTPVRPARAWRPRAASGHCKDPNPRVIADDLWAKLLWAGSQPRPRRPARRTRSPPRRHGPRDHLTWLFAGQSSDEIARLRLGCIRWQHDQPAIGDDPPSNDSSVCLLDIPTHKNGTAFTKPVDPLLGRGDRSMAGLRPAQPPMLDRKTGEKVHFLFRCSEPGRISKNYINDTIIPALCRKAGIPSRRRSRAITSHRARSTIATQLYKPKEPMTLFELQTWLGHRSPESTQHYAKSPPNNPRQGIQRRRLLRPQRPHHRSPRRPRRGHLRRCRRW